MQQPVVVTPTLAAVAGGEEHTQGPRASRSISQLPGNMGQSPDLSRFLAMEPRGGTSKEGWSHSWRGGSTERCCADPMDTAPRQSAHSIPFAAGQRGQLLCSSPHWQGPCFKQPFFQEKNLPELSLCFSNSKKGECPRSPPAPAEPRPTGHQAPPLPRWKRVSRIHLNYSDPSNPNALQE